MRYLLSIASLFSVPAIAETPGIQFRLGCSPEGGIIVLIKANKIGVYQLPAIPHDVCGKDV